MSYAAELRTKLDLAEVDVISQTTHRGHQFALGTLLFALISCEEESPTRVPVYAVEVCAAPHEAPLANGEGRSPCVALGATRDASAEEWPDLDRLPAGVTLREPVRYVRPGANGDGSRASPFGTVTRALASLGDTGGTIALSRGDHPVTEPLVVRGAVTVVGVSPTSTTLSARAAGSLCSVDGAGVSLAFARMRVAESMPLARAAIALTGGASARLDDVRVDGFENALSLNGSRLEGTRLTVSGARRNGLVALAASEVKLTDFVVRDGALQGVFLQDSVGQLARGLIASNGRHGLSLVGTPPTGRGVEGCVGDARTRPGTIECLDSLALVRNGIAGAFLAGPHVVEARLLHVAGTAVVAGLAGGDGLVVTTGASLRIDPERSDPMRRGRGSRFVGNARTGLLAQGTGASLTVRGALIGSNEGPGVYLAERARAEAIGESTLGDNGALGVGGTRSATVATITCNGIEDTRLADLRTAVGTLSLGDGISLANVAGRTEIVANEINRSGRFALVLVGATARAERNSGVGNAIAVGRYGSAIEGTTEGITGAPPPATPPPVARDPLTVEGM